ncbi:MAG: asparagine synthase [Bacteroidales bacterium]|nr:asparagine synthase [Bacteroidales bacterium]
MAGVVFEFRDKGEWCASGAVWAKGYAYDSSDCFFSKQDLCALFLAVRSVDELSQLAKQLNGLFCAVGSLPFGNFALVDRVRSLPLFYAEVLGQLVITDDPYRLIQGNQFFESSVLEFKTAGYVLGGNTLFSEVYQVEAASFICHSDGDVTVVEYFNGAAGCFAPSNYELAKNELKSVLDRCMQRMVKSVEGNRFAVPLSGGYDSRFIIAWLIMNGYTDLVAFTYGRKGNPDMILAERVARKLGLQWDDFPCDDIVSVLSGDVNLEDYVLYASNASSMPFFQDYPAIRKIFDGGVVPRNCVFVLGHSGDFIAGSHLMPGYDKAGSAFLVNDILSVNHAHYKATRSQRARIAERYTQFFNNYKSCAPYSVLEWSDFKERQAKFIVNSCRAYQYFGYNIRLPFFDAELVDFFRRSPFEFKLFKRLYNDVLEDYYFKPLGVSFGDELQSSSYDYRKRVARLYVNRLLPLMRNFSRQTDNLCYADAASFLYGRYNIAPDPLFRRNQICSPIIDWYINFIEKRMK